MSWFLHVVSGIWKLYSNYPTSKCRVSLERKSSAVGQVLAERPLQQKSSRGIAVLRKFFAAPFVIALFLLTSAGLANAQSSLNWVSPAGGEQFVEGSSVQISWSGGDPTVDVNIQLIDVALWQAVSGGIVGATSNDGSEVWNINPNQLPGNVPRDYQLYIQDVNQAFWRYSGTFQIIPRPEDPPRLSITKTAPDECEVGSDCTFTITIENTGGAFTGPLEFEENSIPTGLTLQPANLPAMNNSSWLAAPPATCLPSSTPSLCQVLPAIGGPFTMPANSAVSYEVTIPIPADFDGDAITNCVTLFADSRGVSEDCTDVPVTPTDPPPFSTEHFQCYFVEEDTRLEPIRSPDVVLEDQFGRTENSILKPVLLCAPVNKDGEGMENEKDHLVFYQLKESIAANALVEVENQFGTQRLKVLDSIVLGVPTIKTVIEEDPPILEIKKEAVSSTCISAQSCEFVVTITNSGGPFSGSLDILDITTPPNVELQSITPPLDPTVCLLGITSPFTCSTGPITIAAGSSVSNTYSLIAPGPYPFPLSRFENCVKLIDDEGNILDEDCAMVAVTPKGPENIDFSIDKTVERFELSQTLASEQYTLIVTNEGGSINAPPYSITVTDNLPAGLYYTGVNAPGWTCLPLPVLPGPVMITCAWNGNPTLVPPGPMSAITLAVMNTTGAPVENCADVEIVGSLDEIDLTNNEDCTPGTGGEPELTVHKEAVTQPCIVGQVCDFTVIISNSGAPFTGNLQVNDTTTPPGLNLQPLSPPMPSCAGLPGTTPANCSTGLVTITQGNPLSYTASLLVPDPMSQGWLQNCVELKDASGNPIANSCAGVELVDNSSEERPDLDVHKRPLNGPVSVGDIVTFSIAIDNHGTTIGTGQSVQIVLTDLLPPGFVYTGIFSSSNGLWNCVANFGQIECTWTGGTPILQNSSLGVISIQTKVQKADGGQQCAEISITGMADVNPLNNKDCIDVEVGPRSAGPGGGGTLPDTFACVSGLRNASSSLNMREEPSANAKILLELAQGTPLVVLGRQGNWSQVQIVGDGGAGPTGWVATRFTTEVRSLDQCRQRTQPETPPQENTPDPTPDAGSTPPTTGGEIVDEIINNILPDAGILPIGGTALAQAGLVCEADLPFVSFFLMLRSERSCNAPVTEKLPRGSTVTILEKREGWSMVQIVDGDRRGPIGWGPAKAIDDVKWVIIIR